jgi:hypothetical protein
MNELQRQAYLEALGFTPWVARTPLPGAAPTPVLEPLPEMQGDVQAEPQPVQHAAPAAVAPAETAPPAPQPAAQPAAQSAQARPASATANEAPAAQVESKTEAPLCMHACPMGDVLVLVEQQPADAPDLGRDARELLANLLRAFSRGEQRRRRFDWPMAHVTEGTLEDFLVQFCQSLAPQQVVLVASEQTCQRLMQGERYQVHEHHGLRWLAISGLQEMLAEPAAHKRRSWEAIKLAGLHAPKNAPSA